MARVMWSEASRRDAHNLDDLYDRWKHKRENLPVDEQNADPKRYAAIFAPHVDYSNMSVDELDRERAHLIRKRVFLDQRVVELNNERVSAVGVTGGHLIQQRANTMKRAVMVVNHLIQSQTATVNQLLNEKRRRFFDGVDREYCKFLRDSLVNALSLIDNDTSKSIIDEILSHKFVEGDKPLFGPTDEADT